MSSDDGYSVFRRGGGLVDGLSSEGGRSNDVEGGDTEQTSGVENTGSLENFSTNRDLYNRIQLISYPVSARW